MTATTRSRSVELPDAATLRRLKLSPEVAWYLLDRRIPLPTCPPKFKTPEPKIRGARFDPERVDRVLLGFSKLMHTQGEWAGRPLVLSSWQVAYVIAPVFGWVRLDSDIGRYVRIIRSLYVEVPRRNGKSTLMGGLGLYLTCLDGEKGAQVVAAATTEKQARYVFDPVRDLASKSPNIRPYVEAHVSRISHKPSGSYMQVVSRVAEALHGGNLHAGIIDELHVHKSPDLVEAIETGTGSRRQPLVAMITTADAGELGTIYARKRMLVEQLASRVLTDPSTYGVIWCAAESDDPFAEQTWARANPGYGTSPTRQYLEDAATRAKNSPTELSTFLRLHLGIRTKQATRYVPLPIWDRNASMVNEQALRGHAAYGGLDLASTGDLCSLCWLFPDEQGGYDVVWRHWCPERAYETLLRRTARLAEVWRREGLLQVTDGDVADYGYIRAQINRDRELFDVQTIAYDPWNSSQLVNDLVDDGAQLQQVRQGFASLSAPLKQIGYVLAQGTSEAPMFRHGGDSLMRWQTDNLAVASDPAGNVKPDKSRSGDKIDGWSAAVSAMAARMGAEKGATSAYDDGHGLVII